MKNTYLATFAFLYACKGFSVGTIKSSRSTNTQAVFRNGQSKYGVISAVADLDSEETSLSLKQKAEILKDESDKILKSLFHESLPDLSSDKYKAMIDNLKLTISANAPISTSPVDDQLKGQDRNWLVYDETEKGAPTFSSSGTARLDFFYKVTGGSRRRMVRELLDEAWAENSLDTLQLIAQLRDIRSGKSDRSSSHFALEWLLEKHPLTCIENLKNLVDIGYWKDILSLLQMRCLGERWQDAYFHKNSKYENDPLAKAIARREQRIDKVGRAREIFENDLVYKLLHLTVAEMFALQLKADLELLASPTRNESFSSLAGKWAPSPCNFHDKSTLIASTIAELLFPQDTVKSKVPGEELTRKEFIDIARMKYQKEVLAPLRRASCIPEVFMTAREWNLLPYNRVASTCMKKNSALFEKYDAERFMAYLTAVKAGEGRVASGALKPHEMLGEVTKGQEKSAITDLVNELQWKSYVEDVRSRGTLSNCLAVCDVSGSMCGEPLTAAVSMSMLLAEISKPPYNNIFCSFAIKPVMHEIRGETLRERYDNIVKTHWDTTTNFNAVFTLILDRAVAVKLPPEDMIRSVFVFSDMEFDVAQGRSYVTNFQAAKMDFEAKGYVLPRIVFWNLRGDGRFGGTGPGASVPVRGDEENVVLISGYSGKMLAYFMDGKLEQYMAERQKELEQDEAQKQIGLMDALMAVIKSGAYDKWKVVD